MQRSLYATIARLLGGPVAALPLILSVSGSARADAPPPQLDVDMRCKVEGTAVVCHVTAKPSILAHVTYARVDLVQAPPFLKVVVGSVDYSDSRDKQQRLNLAFIAKRGGTGDIVAKVQAMVCADDGSSCPALSRAVTARVKVGP